MYYMNTMEIEEELSKAKPGSVRQKAAKFLYSFSEEVNNVSDGWAYWVAPVRSAEKLMKLVKGFDTITEPDFKKALSPIKSFYTRKGTQAGMKWPEEK